jgi:Predicted phosphoesterases, related to the Icc protein
LKFVAFSDSHSRHHNLRLPKGDVLICAGDISYRGKKEEVVDFLEWFKIQKHKYKIFIAGNHDFFFEKAKATEISKIIPDNIIYLKDSGVEIEGINIWGSPVTPWFFNWAFNRHRGKDIKKHWDLIPENTELLITHGPVYGYLDQVINEENVGCKDLLERVKEVKPKVHVCGHVHESYGSIKRGGVQFINCSVLNELYELVNKPIVFEI